MVKKGENTKRYDALKTKMNKCAALRVRLSEGPLYTMVEMREGQPVHAHYRKPVDPDQFNDLEMQEIAKTAVEDHNPELVLIKIEYATIETLPFGHLFDLTLQVADNAGRTSSICKAVWRGDCMKIFDTCKKSSLGNSKSKLLNLDDEIIKNEFERIAMAISEDSHDFEKLLSVHEHEETHVIKKGNNGFFTFNFYTINYKANSIFNTSMVKAKWLFTIDDFRADFYRFRARVATQIFNDNQLGRVDSPSPLVVATNLNRPLSDVDLNSSPFESLAMLYVEIYNFENSANLTFDRVVSTTISIGCGKFYHLEIEVEDQHKALRISTEMHRKSGTSLLETREITREN